MPESSEMGRGWRENLWLRLTLWPKQPPNFNLLQEHLFTSYHVIWVLHGCCKLTAFLSLLMGSSGISLGLAWLYMASHFGPQPLCSHGGKIHCTYKTAWEGGRTNRSLLTNDIIYYYCLLFYYKYLLPSYEQNILNIFPQATQEVQRHIWLKLQDLMIYLKWVLSSFWSWNLHTETTRHPEIHEVKIPNIPKHGVKREWYSLWTPPFRKGKEWEGGIVTGSNHFWSNSGKCCNVSLLL